MLSIFKTFSDKVGHLLKSGGVGVIPTDTIYGIVGSALKKDTVERIYKLRSRSPKKPMIVLIGSVSDLKKFGVRIDTDTKKIISELWAKNNPVSVILPVRGKGYASRFFYLHRGKGSIAFRLPAKKSLREFLKKIGPLVAPSANLEGEPPAKTIREAKKYFGNRVDFYVDGGETYSKPSRLIKIQKGEIKVLRS